MDTQVSGGGHASTTLCGVCAGLDTSVWGRACIYPPVWCRCRAGLHGHTRVWWRACIYPPVWCRCRAGHMCLGEGLHLPPCVVSVAGLDTSVWWRACIYPPVWCQCRARHKCLVEGLHLPPCVVSVPGWPTWTPVSGGGPASTPLCGVSAGLDTSVWGRACIYPLCGVSARLAYMDTCVWGRACIYPPVWCQCRAGLHGHMCLGEGLHLLH